MQIVYYVYQTSNDDYTVISEIIRNSYYIQNHCRKQISLKVRFDYPTIAE